MRQNEIRRLQNTASANKLNQRTGAPLDAASVVGQAMVQPGDLIASVTVRVAESEGAQAALPALVAGQIEVERIRARTQVKLERVRSGGHSEAFRRACEGMHELCVGVSRLSIFFFVVFLFYVASLVASIYFRRAESEPPPPPEPIPRESLSPDLSPHRFSNAR
jgi:hypothetical protein